MRRTEKEGVNIMFERTQKNVKLEAVIMLFGSFFQRLIVLLEQKCSYVEEEIDIF